MLKKCISSLSTHDKKSCYSISEAGIIAELLDILIKDDINTKISESDKTRYSIDSYQKEVLCLAILADKYNDKELIGINTDVSKHHYDTQRLTVFFVKKTTVPHQYQINYY